jgi:inhibitor of KinA
MAGPFIRDYRLSPLGDRALVIELGADATEQTALRVRCVSEKLLADALPGVLDVVPAVCTVALHYDPLRIVPLDDAAGAYATLAQQVTARLQSMDSFVAVQPATLEVPVCYGGEYGEDLDVLARSHELSAEQVIELHCAPLYRVQMLGFAPGFAYLAGLDPRLATPRRPNPRMRVPAGSVAIGGELTGIYPLELPGGWHLIGRSPLSMFDAGTQPPTRLSIGDHVRFVPVSPREYARLAEAAR